MSLTGRAGSSPARTKRRAALQRAAQWLALAAAPTFTLMALSTSAWGGMPNPMCATGHQLAIGGMDTMYLLMAAFHLAPWLRLLDAAGPSSA